MIIHVYITRYIDICALYIYIYLYICIYMLVFIPRGAMPCSPSTGEPYPHLTSGCDRNGAVHMYAVYICVYIYI